MFGGCAPVPRIRRSHNPSANAVLAEPWAIFLVHLLNMFEKTVVQLRQQRTQVEGLAVLQPVRSLQNLRQHLMVCSTMLAKA